MRSLFTLNECARVRVETRDFTVFVCVFVTVCNDPCYGMYFVRY